METVTVRAEVVVALEVTIGPHTPFLQVGIATVSERKLVQVVGARRIGAGGNRDTGAVRSGIIVQHVLRNQPAVRCLVPLHDDVATVVGRAVTTRPKRADGHGWGQSSARSLVKHRAGRIDHLHNLSVANGNVGVRKSRVRSEVRKAHSDACNIDSDGEVRTVGGSALLHCVHGGTGFLVLDRQLGQVSNRRRYTKGDHMADYRFRGRLALGEQRQAT